MENISRTQKFNKLHPDYHKEYRKLESNKKYRKGYEKIYLQKIRNATIEALGAKCVKCGFEDRRALQIDHINGGGSKERKERPYKGSFHKSVLKSFMAKENKYQLLCANCNWIKRVENNEIREQNDAQKKLF